MKIHAEAVRYAANGWPVAPLAVPNRAGCPCGKVCVDPHVVGEVVRDGFRAAEVWPEPPRTTGARYGRGDANNLPAGGVGDPLSAGGRWGIALVAEWFDVMELPPEYGALLNHQLKATCPTAMAPAKRQWWFFVEQGSVPREQVVKAGGVLRSGVGDWVPAPGTWSEDTGRIRWLVQPHLTEWRPYQRMDPIERVFACL